MKPAMKLKRNEQKALEQVQALGVKLIPVTVPEWTVDVSSIGVESGAFFDELIRTNRDKQMTNPGRAASFRSSRAVPAVEYLQGQRARTMMMMKLAEATADVDVYLVPVNMSGGGGRGGRGATGADAAAADTAGRGRGGTDGFAAQRRSPLNRHFTMANLAGYPALNVVNGFTDAGTPSSICIYGRPFAEAEVLAFGKAYQDATQFYLRHPKLES
jgi:Asp-tRNA(Asn)/Glu-tRNA(Gln) amidotransferase A subunit family amidase